MSDAERLNAGLESRLRDEGAQVRALRAGCPPPELLLARDAEALTAEARRHLDVHLAICGACRRLAADLARLDLGAADSQADGRVRERVLGGAVPRRFGALLPIAATLLLACALAVQALFEPVAPAAPPVADAVSTPGRPSMSSGPDAALWAIAAPSLRLTLSSLDQTRGDRRATATLVGAAAPYQAGDYRQAGERFAEVARMTPASGDAQFYLGVSRLLAGAPRDAIAPLTAARTLLPPARSREVDWYLATAEQRSADPASARARLDALCDTDGVFRQEACAAVTRLR